MKWDVQSIQLLTKIVDKKFDEEFRHDLEGWKKYLIGQGIVRRSFMFKKSSGGIPHVWIECPSSVHNSIPGAVYTKSELCFPMDLAEKIIVLEGMP